MKGSAAKRHEAIEIRHQCCFLAAGAQGSFREASVPYPRCCTSITAALALIIRFTAAPAAYASLIPMPWEQPLQQNLQLIAGAFARSSLPKTDATKLSLAEKVVKRRDFKVMIETVTGWPTGSSACRLRL